MKTLKRWIKNIRWLLNHPPTNMTDDRSLELTCEFCRNQANCVKLGDTITVCWNCIARALRETLEEKLPANIIGPCAVQALKYLDDVVPKTTKTKRPTMGKTKNDILLPVSDVIKEMNKEYGAIHKKIKKTKRVK